MKIGILQTGYVPPELVDRYGEYPEMFMKLLEGNDFKWETYAVVDNIFPESIHSCEGWLITGSKHGAYEEHSWIPPLEQFIRDTYAADIPMVGICFGHQIMAQALGGKVEKFGGLWGAGRNVYQAAEGTIAVQAMHQDQVTEKPADATVTASSEFCKNAAFAYQRRAISYQPHPEFSTDFTRDLIEARAGTVLPSEQAEKSLSTIDGELDSHRIADEIAAFFKSV